MYDKLEITQGIHHKGNIPNAFVSKKIVLKFNLCNTSDSTVSAWFFPGFYYTAIQLYTINESVIKKLPVILPPIADSIGYRLISIPAKDSVTLLAELTFLKTYINSIRPRLISFEYVGPFITELRSNQGESNQMTYLFCGLLLMMILFSFTNFLQGANPEFLFYSGYAFFLGSMLLTKAMYAFNYSPASFFFESYLDFILQGMGIMFYMIFTPAPASGSPRRRRCRSLSSACPW